MNKENSDYEHVSGSSEHTGRSVQKKELTEEYILVPAESYYSKDDRELIDVIGLLKDLWINRLTILTIATIFILIGLFIFLGSERIYYSEAKLMPESSSSRSQVGQLFQQYESILGIQTTPDDNDIRVAMYPYIVESIPFQIELMQHEIYFSKLDRRISIYEYFQEYHEKSLTEKTADFLWNFTIGLPVTIYDFFTSLSAEDRQRPDVDFTEFENFEVAVELDSRVRSVATTVSSLITVTRDPQTGFVSIGVSMSDPYASTEMVLLVRNLLQQYVVEYRTEKALDDLRFIEQRFEEAKAAFLAAQDSLATYQDRNVNTMRQSVAVREQRLQSEFDIAFTLYNTLARRLQESEITVQEETPVFRTHEPPTVSNRPASPNIIRIMGGAIFIGLFLGVAFIYVRRAVKLFVETFKLKEPKPYLS